MGQFADLITMKAGPLVGTMAKAGSLEILADAGGSVTCGFLTEDVFYARFSRVLSARLGEAFTARLTKLLGDTDGVACFMDFQQVETYDLQARQAFGRLLTEQNDKLLRFEVLAWSGETNPSRLDALGRRADITRDPDVFEARLFAVAPAARDKLAPRPESPYRSRLLRR